MTSALWFILGFLAGGLIFGTLALVAGHVTGRDKGYDLARIDNAHDELTTRGEIRHWKDIAAGDPDEPIGFLPAGVASDPDASIPFMHSLMGPALHREAVRRLSTTDEIRLIRERGEQIRAGLTGGES